METADDALDIDPEIIDRLDSLTEATREELTSTVFPQIFI